jgi:hypothetical protein
MRSSLFWDVTQSRLVVSYRRFGKSCQSQYESINDFAAVIFLMYLNGLMMAT